MPSYIVYISKTFLMDFPPGRLEACCSHVFVRLRRSLGHAGDVCSFSSGICCCQHRTPKFCSYSATVLPPFGTRCEPFVGGRLIFVKEVARTGSTVAYKILFVGARGWESALSSSGFFFATSAGSGFSLGRNKPRALLLVSTTNATALMHLLQHAGCYVLYSLVR